MSDSNGETGAFLAGFVIGALSGAAAALMLAPQSGAETRAQIANRGQELRNRGEAQLQEARTTADAYRRQAEETVSEAQEQARIVLDEGRQRLSGSRIPEAPPIPSDDEPPTTGSI